MSAVEYAFHLSHTSTAKLNEMRYSKMKGTIFKTTAASLALITTLFAATSCANASASNVTEAGTSAPEAGKHYSIINVSYDPTRELYAAYNEAFK